MAAVWAPFVEEEDDDEAVNFKQVIGQTVGAIVQVATTGTLTSVRRRSRFSETPVAGSTGCWRGAGGLRRRLVRGGVMDSLRISDADRESAVDLLGEQYVLGRLTREEFDERSDVVWSARTRAISPRSSSTCRAVRSPGLPPAVERGRLSRRGFPVPAGTGADRAGRDRRIHPPAVPAARAAALVRLLAPRLGGTLGWALGQPSARRPGRSLGL